MHVPIHPLMEKDWVTLHCVNRPWGMYPFINWWRRAEWWSHCVNRPPCVLILPLMEKDWAMVHYVNRPQCVYPFFHWWRRAEWWSIVWIDHVACTHSSIGGHWGCIHLSAIASTIAINMGVQRSVLDPAFNSFGYGPKAKLLDHMAVLFVIFWGAAIILFTAAALFDIPRKCAQGSSFSTSSPACIIIVIISCLLMGMRLHLIVVLIEFPSWWVRLSIFSWAHCHL